jgi:hypothetical protein
LTKEETESRARHYIGELVVKNQRHALWQAVNQSIDVSNELRSDEFVTDEEYREYQKRVQFADVLLNQSD